MLSRASLEQAYRREQEPRVRERLMLVLRVRIDGATPAQASREARRSKGWASYWLERYDAQGIDGLRDKKRSGRPPQMGPRVRLRIRRMLREERQCWRTKEVWELVRREAGITYSERHVYRLLHSWGYRSIVPRKRFVRTATREERAAFKKG